VPEANRESGLMIIKPSGVLVKSHGTFDRGTDAFDAVHNAVVLEEIANMNFRTILLNQCVQNMQQELLDKHYLRKHEKIHITVNNKKRRNLSRVKSP